MKQQEERLRQMLRPATPVNHTQIVRDIQIQTESSDLNEMALMPRSRMYLSSSTDTSLTDTETESEAQRRRKREKSKKNISNKPTKQESSDDDVHDSEEVTVLLNIVDRLFIFAQQSEEEEANEKPVKDIEQIPQKPQMNQKKTTGLAPLSKMGDASELKKSAPTAPNFPKMDVQYNGKKEEKPTIIQKSPESEGEIEEISKTEGKVEQKTSIAGSSDEDIHTESDIGEEDIPQSESELHIAHLNNVRNRKARVPRGIIGRINRGIYRRIFIRFRFR